MILVSACLCGHNCTYRGDNHHHPLFARLCREGRAIPVCPEQLGGLPTPRPPSEILNGDGYDVLKDVARVVNSEGSDVSRFFVKGAVATLDVARRVGACRAVLKARSPSCGSGKIYDGTFSGRLRPGDGVTTALLRQHGIEVCSDEEYLAGQGADDDSESC
ncbi:MAG: DUF523 domain-containing protein [Syntrophomonadaceae bacterium]|nr:DUF523 domain-containing protein [Syntrophomonadaceae bacterium]